MYTTVYHVLFWGNPEKFTSIRTRTSYEKNNLIQCVNIINEEFPNV